MRLVTQRVKKAKVAVEGRITGQIGPGMLILVGIAKGDTEADAERLAEKCMQLRIFEDEQGRMNRSAQECGGAFLVVSQFTLLGDCRKGRRPSFDKAAEPQKAEQLYQYFVEQLQKHNGQVQTGEFKAMMDVRLVNDGPVTFILESQ